MLLAVMPQLAPDYAGMVTTLSKLHELLDTARADRGLTVAVQAKQMGLAASTLTNLYRGKGEPSLSTVLAALRWLART